MNPSNPLFTTLKFPTRRLVLGFKFNLEGFFQMDLFFEFYASGSYTKLLQTKP